MERLHFGPDAKYSALEAAIHVARYALAKSICPGKTVLDVACGEGYGSWLLASWGAEAVTGIDISAEAIETARRRFGRDGVDFLTADATRLRNALKGKQFDLIVSIETIEHVKEPDKLLRGIKAVAAPGATIIITCPNDHWYYAGAEGNPFHTRKYRLEDFQALTQSVLGPATSFRVGSLAAGFGSTPLFDSAAAPDDDQSAMMRVRPVPTGLMVPSEEGAGPTPKDCSFFVGIWGQDIDEVATVTFPLSMDASDRSLFGGPRISELNDYIRRLEARRDELEAHVAALASREESTRPKPEHASQRLEAENAKLVAALAGERESTAKLVQGLEAENARLVTALAGERESTAKLVQGLETAVHDLRASQAKVLEIVGKEREELEERYAALASDLKAARESRSAAEAEVTQREVLIDDLRARLSRQETRIAQLDGAKAEADRARGEAEEQSLRLAADVAERDAEVTDLQRTLRSISLRLRGVAAENQVLRARASQIFAAAEETQSRIQTLENRMSEQEGALVQARAENATLHEQVSRQEGALVQARAENAALREQVSRQEGALVRVHAENAALREQVSEQEGALVQARAENAALHEQAHELAGQLAAIPWRVVGMYRKVRPLVPRGLLRLGASAIDARSRRP